MKTSLVLLLGFAFTSAFPRSSHHGGHYNSFHGGPPHVGPSHHPPPHGGHYPQHIGGGHKLPLKIGSELELNHVGGPLDLEAELGKGSFEKKKVENFLNRAHPS